MESIAYMAAEQQPRTFGVPSKPRVGLLAALRKPSAASSESSAESEDEHSESDRDTLTQAPIISQQLPMDVSSQEANEEDSDNGGAYERMKRRLAASKAAQQPQTTRSIEEVAPPPTTVISSDDEDEMPVRTNVRKSSARKAKSQSPPASPTLSTRSRRSSPGLFVTPNATPVKSRAARSNGSDSDATPRPPHNADLQERIRRIRAERLAKEKEAQTQLENARSSKRRIQNDSDSDTDGESGRRLTQQAKPTRKAGKKAMEMMARDQQRISRNMQLTHQAKTKKKHGMSELFSRFGYNAPLAHSSVAESLPTPEPSSALTSSDAEANQTHDTPPTSPPRQESTSTKDLVAIATADASATANEPQDEPSSLTPRVDKGKGRAPEFQHLLPRSWENEREVVRVHTAQTDVKEPADHAMIELSDSDDDLEITQTKSRFPVFDRIPLKKQQESSSLLHLRHLAHLTSSDSARKGPKSISLGEMQMSLAIKARQQAQQEREEKIAELKRRGIHIETEEEREKNEMEIDDMVAQFEKQRQEDLKLAKTERDEAKKNGETIDGLPSSDESDGDYVGSGEETKHGEAETDNEEVELELSGSEDEEMDVEIDGEAEEGAGTDGLVADLANERDGDLQQAAQEQQVDEDADMEDEEPSAPVRKRTVTRTRNIVIDEDDESDNDTPKPASPTQEATQDNAMAAFGFGNADTGLGLTQMFAGTMANLESESQHAPAEPDQDSLEFLRGLPDTQPGANFSQTSDFMVPNSQSLMSPQKHSQTESEFQFSLGISELIKTSPAFSRTQMEDLPEPTQDAGFSFSRSPAGLMQPPSTVDTVMMSIAESPIKQRKGKLLRGRQAATAVELPDVEEDFIEVEEGFSEEDDIQRPPKPRNAFAKLQQGAKKQKAVAEFNKKTSMAKDAVMDQAEESEDEYAGLGGASDDDSGVEDEETNKMIEHGEVDVDERQIAALFADNARKEDEKNINELYKNVMNGGLRRRAGGRDGFDMSDSEDEEDMRLRKKRAEFQKMNRALLADERIGNIAKDQKKQAFFHTLADFADEGDYEFLEVPADLGLDGEPSQSQEEGQKAEGTMEDIAVPDSQIADAGTNPLKRKSPSNSQKENRPPPNLRRTAASDVLARKPITLADVQNSVSELLDDPRIVVPDSQFSHFSESEDDEESFTRNATSRKPIVDRLSLSRTCSLSEGTADSGGLAFHAPSRASGAPGFRVPSLIRQATSNLSTTSESRRSSGASTPSESVRRGGTGKSNIHAQAREAERRVMLEKKEKKRKEVLKKKVSAGRKGGMRSVLGDLGGGFE